jgi:uncharacterized protein (DUF58 family)
MEIPLPAWLEKMVNRVDLWQKRLPLTREGKFWLVFALGLLATGLFRSINLINLLSCFMLTALALNLWSARRQLRLLRGYRIAEQAFFAQAPSPVTLEISNCLSRHLRGLRLVQQKQERFIASLRGKETADVSIPLLFPRRGRFKLSPFRVRSGYPLGLADFRQILVPEEEIIVLPRLGNLRRGALRNHLHEHSPTLGQSRTVPRRHPAAQTDFHGMRTFQPGDSPRWIHWRTSARRGELMVKEFEETPTDNLILILDPFVEERASRVSGGSAPSDDPHLELAISLAATICWEWCRQKGDRIVLAIGGDNPVAIGGITSADLAIEMLRHLAVQSGGPSTNIPALLDCLAGIELPAAATLVISTHECEYFDELQQETHRTIAHVNVSRLEHEEFYEEVEL